MASEGMRNQTASESASTSGLTPSLRVLIGLAAAVIALAGLSFARDIVGPLALGAVLVIICHPLRFPLERAGWPRWAATSAVIVVGYAVLAALAAMLAFAGNRFYLLVVDYAPQMEATGREVLAWLESMGIDLWQSVQASGLLDPMKVLTTAVSVGGSAVSVLTALFFMFAYVLFMAFDASRYARAAEKFGDSARPAIARAVEYCAGVRRYYVVNAVFGAIVAIVDGLALWLLNVPAPVVWAVLAFVTNFVPNVGFVLGLIPPVVLAFVVGGWPLMLAVTAIYIVVNVTLQVLIQPKFVSDAVNITLTLSFLSVVFWTFVIGPLGAILSIPLTLLLRTLVLEGDPGARWLRWLSGDNSVGLPPGAAAPPAMVASEVAPVTAPDAAAPAADECSESSHVASDAQGPANEALPPTS